MIRGVEPVEGIAQMEINRSKSGPDLSNGPGKLVKALGITPDYYGHSIFLQVHCILSTRKRRTPKEILAVPRIGIPNKGEWTHKPLRFVVAGNPYITNNRKSAVQPDHGWQ